MLCKKLVSIMCLFVLCLAVTGLGQGTGTIRYEVWEGIGGTAVTDLTGNANFPENPSWDDEVALFETPTNILDNFGGRLYGLLHPDADGDYTFWIAADDGAELWLSTTDSAADAQLIAFEDAWAGPRSWADGNERSAPISLVAGQAYYIEALYKEGGGGDNLAVGWSTTPDISTVAVIDGAFLSPAPRQASMFKAGNVGPADGAIEVAPGTMLEWTAGPTAVTHKVYLSTDATIDETDLLVETADTNTAPALAVGTTYYWRVDEVDADAAHEGHVWSFSVISDQAHFPAPIDGDVWRLGVDTELSWTSGLGALTHDVYYSSDKALVDARDPSVASTFWLMNTFAPPELNPGTVYYWAVDEFTGAATVAGPTWNFLVFSFDAFAITDPSLVLRYAFDEIQGGLINDLSGYENYGVVVGDPQIVTVDGESAMSFNGAIGSPQYVDGGNDSIVQTNGSATVAAWVKMNEGNDGVYMGIGGKLRTAPYAGLSLVRHSSGVFRLWADDGNATLVATSSDETYTDTEWHHVVGVADDGTTALYVDGVKQIASETVSLTDSNEFAHVGRQYAGLDDRYWSGLIDDFRIYTKALTELEVQRLYDPTIEDPNVLIHYDFESGDGTMVVDQSGNGNDGLFMGTPELVEGLFGTAVSIVLEDVDYIETTAPLNIVSNTVSVTGWIMHDEAPAAWSGLLTTRGAGGNLGLQHNGSELRYMWGPDLYWSFSSGLEIPNGEWYFAALAISPDQAMLYLNGIGVDQTAANIAAHDPVTFDDLIRVGRDHTDGRIMTSLIDEVRFFDRTITGEDVERLMETPPVIAWVSFHTDANDGPNGDAAGAGFTEAPDKAYTDLLKANGYTVIRTGTSKTPDVDLLNSADLVITSRSVNSGDYSGDGATLWNGITTPIIIVGGYPLRSSRMGYTTGGTMVDTVGDINLAVLDPNHPIFTGIDLADGVMVNPFAGVVNYPTDGTLARGVSVNTSEVNAEGTILGIVANADDPTAGGMVIGEWLAGATLTHDGGAGTDVLAGDRLVFLTGAREASGISSRTAGLYDLYDDGASMFLNAVEYMLTGDVQPVEVPSVALVEDFDSLPVGSSMHDVPGWEGWFGDPQWAAQVVDTVAYSGTNSMEIKGTRDDVVPNWPMVDSGVYVASVMQYVPTGTAGSMYYGPLSSYGASWDDTAWLGTLLSNCDAGTVYVNELDAATRTEAPLVRDDWVELKIVMNFDADTCDFYYGDTLLGTLPCPSAMGFDIWPDDNVDVIYYDDFSFGAE